MPAMPTTTQVVPGALVNIVLKADQPTGRTIQGTVSQLLTRGNHPRGIKVRLTDGSVGRVQSMAGTTAGVTAAAEYPTQAAGHTQSIGEGGPTNTSNSGRIRYHDVRTDQEQPPSTQPIGLDAYIKPAKKRGRAKKAATATADVTAEDRSHGLPVHSDQPSPAPQESACPVCGDFRGDGPALTHHVQSHFAD
jgi:uncharacterized repeat protein (TIGR03833 family)